MWRERDAGKCEKGEEDEIGKEWKDKNKEKKVKMKDNIDTPFILGTVTFR